MGFFDFLKSKKPAGTDGQPIDKDVQRLARVAANKYSQNYDRMEAIHQLAAMGTEESAAALLRRFTYYIEPSITDQDEKDAAFRGVANSRDAAIGPILDFCVRAESLTWPMKILEEILSQDKYVDELLEMLSRFDTEYTKNSEPKIQLISALESRVRPDVLEAVLPFLEDVNEPVRFHAVITVFAQNDDMSAIDLCKALISEESVRVRNRICDGLAIRDWTVPDDLRAQITSMLPADFRLVDGKIRRA